MKNCPECGKEFSDSENFCPECGKYVPAMKLDFEHGEQHEEMPVFTEENTESAQEKKDAPATAFNENPKAKESTPDLSTPSVWSFVLTLFMCSIPVIGFIYLIVLAFGGTKYPAKKNYARAIFLYMFIVAVISSAITVLMILFFGDSMAMYFGTIAEMIGKV